VMKGVNPKSIEGLTKVLFCVIIFSSALRKREAWDRLVRQRAWYWTQRNPMLTWVQCGVTAGELCRFGALEVPATLSLIGVLRLRALT